MFVGGMPSFRDFETEVGILDFDQEGMDIILLMMIGFIS